MAKCSSLPSGGQCRGQVVSKRKTTDVKLHHIPARHRLLTLQISTLSYQTIRGAKNSCLMPESP